MATTDELIAQTQAASTTDQLDAIQAQSQDPNVAAAVQARRDQLAAASTRRSAGTAGEVGPNAVTDPAKPQTQYYEISNGDGTFRKVNAWGEEKGSTDDKKRW